MLVSSRLCSACPLQEALLGDWLCFSPVTDCSMDLQCLPAPVATSIPGSEGLAPLPSDSDAKGLPTSLPAASLLPSPDCVPLPVPESVEDFTDGDIIGEELDSLLDSLAEGSPYPLVRAAQVPCFLFQIGFWSLRVCVLPFSFCQSFILALPLAELIHSGLCVVQTDGVGRSGGSLLVYGAAGCPFHSDNSAHTWLEACGSLCVHSLPAPCF